MFQLHTFLLVSDDILDNSSIRNGRTCWYRFINNKGMAMNDCIFLEQAIYQILKKYFKDKPYYTDVLEIFHDVREYFVFFPICL